MFFKISRVVKTIYNTPLRKKMTHDKFFGFSITAMFGIYLYQNLFPTNKKIENKS